MHLPWRGALVVAAAGLFAVAAPLAAKTRPAKSAPAMVEVTINNLAYAPPTITAHVGDKVEWVNNDIFLHSATTPDFDVVVKPGASGRVLLLKPGVINYICRYHPGMKGQIVVQK
jgi:plastocyanin